MNIVQIHERARFLLDVVASARFESEDLDNAINGEIELIVREKYDRYRLNNRSDAFEINQRVRDELQPIYQSIDSDQSGFFAYPTVSGKSCLCGFADFFGGNQTIFDFRYLLNLQVLDVAGNLYPCFPMTYNERNVYTRNPFRRTRKSPWPKFYYLESATTAMQWDILMDLDSDSDFDKVFLTYLNSPAIVSWGVEYDSGQTFSNGTNLIAIEETVYAGTTYVIGGEITIANPNYSITSGLVVRNFVDCNLSASLHEEISRRAAVSLLKSVSQFDKANAITQDIIAT